LNKLHQTFSYQDGFNKKAGDSSHQSHEVLKIDPERGECSILGDLGHGGWKYHGGAARLQLRAEGGGNQRNLGRDLALFSSIQNQRLGVLHCFTVGVLLFSAGFENSRSASSCVLNGFWIQC